MKNLTLLLIALLSCISCDKDDDVKKHGELSEATIIYTGEFESDGCGWLLKVNDKFYSPVNLNKAYQNNEQAVFVAFEILAETLKCGFPTSNTPKYSKISILEIRAK